MFPPVAACTACHNGNDVKPVAWSRRALTPTNLRFDHARHARLADSAGTHLDCAVCHGEGPSSGRMLVTRARPETCIGCHAHPAPSHFAPTSPCTTCHSPLARATTLSDSAVAVLPKPSWHDATDFITSHGALAQQSTASCAVCHTRESCARCHVNAATLQPIAALGTDPRIAHLVRGKPAVYLVPPSHRRPDFLTAHAALARTNVQGCATCHARPSCRTCHTGSLGGRIIDQLPDAEPGRPAGVQLRAPRPTPPPQWPGTGLLLRPANVAAAAVDTPPATMVRADSARVVHVHPPDFVRTHGPVAASGRLDCAGCHERRLCTSCHQGSGERRYHPFNFVARHPSEAYAREARCASCHNTEVFCRSCHRDVAGIGAGSKRRSGAAHAGQPLWLLQHGDAARRGMQGCASCHQQTDCMQCHSAAGGRINPHGRDFNAAQMRKRNPSLCALCHLTTPG
jgi:predicted CXXCH cytochrome family protein